MSDNKKQDPLNDNAAHSGATVEGSIAASNENLVSHPPVRRRTWTRWILPIAALVTVIALGLVLRAKLHDDIWAYYTDDECLRVAVEEKKERMVLWEDPQQHLFQQQNSKPGNSGAGDPVNQASQRVEAAFSADGTMMVLTRWSNSGQVNATELEDPGADLYFSTWDGRTWSRPEPMVDLNTACNERGAAFSRDGQYLYFGSDREGGAGGYDLYVARTDGKTWTAVERLSDSVNSPQNESGPAPSADGERLYFSSDRDSEHDAQDIYVATRVVTESDRDASGSPDVDAPEAEKQGQQAPLAAPNLAEGTLELPPVPMFANAEPVSRLNSTADDIEAALTGRGDQVFFASDRDRDDRSGFNLYLSRVIAGQVQAPQQIDVYIKQGNATDPAVRMDGFDLLFSADRVHAEQDPDTAVAAAQSGYRLYRSTTREVIGYTDLSRWEMFKNLMSKIMWWILLAIAALMGLIYLLEKWRDITDLFHKCLAGSVAAHLLLLIVMMFWFISQALDEGGWQQSPEVALSIDALAQEELAMESEQDLAEVADSTQMIVSKNVQDFQEVVFNPQQVDDSAIPISRRTSDQSLVSDFRPSQASESTGTEPVPKPIADVPALAELSPVELPDLAVDQLELAVQPNEIQIEPVDPTKDDFKRDDESIQQVETVKAVVERTEYRKLDVQTEAAAVAGGGERAKTIDTGGEAVNVTDGFEADGTPPKLEGIAASASFAANLPGDDPLDAFPRGEKLETGDHELDANAISNRIKKRRGKLSDEVVEQLGGSQGTERAIGLGLDWFTDHQESDGRWEMEKYGGKSQYNTAGAGIALLCYYGWGIKQGPYADNPKYAKHANAVTKALDWLLKQQKEDGDLRGVGGNHGMYCHGIAAIALCEGYGLTEDPKLKEPATKAIEFILKAQHEGGGWRYQPRQAGDLSVTGWQCMALHSARMAGIDVPDEAFAKADKFTTSVSGGAQGGLYGYTGPDKNNPTMTATGMFLRQLDLAAPTESRMQESAGVLKSRMLKANRVDFYFDYYATLALYQHQGPIWRDWNENLKEIYVTLQKSTGPDKGSWDTKGRHVNSGGRVLSTGLAILSLEVYYRLLPMYGFDRDDDKNAID